MVVAQLLVGQSGIGLLIAYRHECFTGKYTACETHAKLYPGLEWRGFHILISEDIEDISAFVASEFVPYNKKNISWRYAFYTVMVEK